MQKFKVCWIGIIIFALLACSRQLPMQNDGTLKLDVIVADQSTLVEVDSALGYAPLAGATVTLTSRNYYVQEDQPVTFTATTDAAGVAHFKGLDAGSYTAFVEAVFVTRDEQTGFEQEVKLTGGVQVELEQAFQVADTIKTVASVASKLVINEVYFTGPPNKAYYFFDQFVELYNASDETVYLDALVVGRARPYHHPDMETNDFVQAVYLYQFPGQPGGTDYPLEPKSFCVIATDAINHGAYIEGAADLSNADWEFYNPYKGDYDAPAPDVVNALPGQSVDFYISLAHNAVILAEGDGWYFGEYSSSGYQYVHIPIDKVLDAVEYSSNPDKAKELTARVDAGYAGIGIAKYDGQSTERRIPGSDTNNSTLDFVTISKPTPGYQHE